METPEQYTVKTPEDEFNEIIDRIETRAMACDGPVTPTLQEATEAELSRLWELVNEISPKRKAIARRILQGKETDQDTNDYLIANGLDPDVVGKTGALFVKAVSENITLKEENRLYREALQEVLDYDYKHLISRGISAVTAALSYKIRELLSKFQPKKDESTGKG